MAGIRALLVLNPRAGDVFSSLSEEKVRDRLRSVGIDCELWTPSVTPEATPFPARHDLVVVCGGDGTVHRLLPHLAGSGIPMGLIPAGTANVLARELGIPRNLDAAVDAIARGRIRPIHLGRANDRLFHLMGGAGLDGYLLDKVGTRSKRILGVAAFWLSGLWSFWGYRFEEIEVRIGDEEHSGAFVVVSNCRRYGGTLLLAPRANVFESGLDVCLFQSSNRLRYVRYLWGTLTGTHIELPDVVYRKAERVLVRGRRPVKVQLDGEPAGFLPVEFRSADETLHVVVPDSPR